MNVFCHIGAHVYKEQTTCSRIALSACKVLCQGGNSSELGSHVALHFAALCSHAHIVGYASS